jgi:transposase-like protein
MTENISMSYNNKSNKIKCPFCNYFNWLNNIKKNKDKISQHCLRNHNIKLSTTYYFYSVIKY